MYENKIITEPKWKSWIIQTTTPLFTPDQCRQIIECGRRQPPQKANENHFGFGDIRITENAQFTEYPEGGFYDWHMDCDTHMEHEPPVRKISMTLLLNDPSEFEGGHLELGAPGKFGELKQGHAICFASFINHRVQPVKRGLRQSLVVWFGGKPFR
jgi:PKHD-type hydroxylase